MSSMFKKFPTTSTRNEVERVRSISAEHTEVTEIDCPLNEEDGVGKNDETQEEYESLIVSKVLHVHVLRHLFSQLLLPRLFRYRLRRNQPFS